MSKYIYMAVVMIFAAVFFMFNKPIGLKYSLSHYVNSNVTYLKNKNTNNSIPRHTSTPILEKLKENSESISALTQAQLQSLSETLSPIELHEIKNIILSPQEKGDKRLAFNFLLSQLGIAGADTLAEIIKFEIPHFENSENPHSAGSLEKAFEISLRITALEALDSLVVENPQLKAKIVGILNVQKEQSLNFLIQLSLSGIESNQPGKIKRFIDKVLTKRNI